MEHLEGISVLQADDDFDACNGDRRTWVYFGGVAGRKCDRCGR